MCASCACRAGADQGEANAKRANAYAQQMRTMIADWRHNWAGSPSTLKDFTFILHQLSAYSGR